MDMDKRKRSSYEQDVDRELREKGLEARADFDESQVLSVPARPRETKLISIRIPVEMMKELRRIADQKGYPGYQRMIKKYIAEGLQREEYPASDKNISDHATGYLPPATATSDAISLDLYMENWPNPGPIEASFEGVREKQRKL